MNSFSNGLIFNIYPTVPFGMLTLYYATLFHISKLLQILLDFEKQYKEKSLNFYKNWEHFFSKLLKLRESMVTNEDAKAIIEGLGNIIDDGKYLHIYPVCVGLVGLHQCNSPCLRS